MANSGGSRISWICQWGGGHGEQRQAHGAWAWTGGLGAEPLVGSGAEAEWIHGNLCYTIDQAINRTL